MTIEHKDPLERGIANAVPITGSKGKMLLRQCFNGGRAYEIQLDFAGKSYTEN
jgi:hypothetical protein